MSISGRLLHAYRHHEWKQVSVFLSSTIWLALETLIFFPIVFHVWSFLFLIGDQRLICPVWIQSLTNVLNSFWPISLCSKRSSFTKFAWHYNLCHKVKEIVALIDKGIREILHCRYQLFYVSLFMRNHRSWQGMMMGAFLAGVVSAISLASTAKRASSGTMRKNFVQAFGYQLSLLRLTLSNLFCSRAWSTPKAQNGTCGFLLTTQLPFSLRNSSCISGSDSGMRENIFIYKNEQNAWHSLIILPNKNVFFYPCNKRHILLNIFSILPSLSTLDQSTLSFVFMSQWPHNRKTIVRSYIIAHLTHSNHLWRFELFLSKIWYSFIQSLVSMLGVWRCFLKHPLKLLCAGCKVGNITFLLILGPLNTTCLVACFLHELLTEPDIWTICSWTTMHTHVQNDC